MDEKELESLKLGEIDIEPNKYMKSMFHMLKQRSESQKSKTDINNEIQDQSSYLPSRSRSKFGIGRHWTSENAYNTYDRDRNLSRARGQLKPINSKENKQSLYNLTTTLNEVAQKNQNSNDQILPNLGKRNSILEDSLFHDSRELNSSIARRIRQIDRNKINLTKKMRNMRSFDTGTSCLDHSEIKQSISPQTRTKYVNEKISHLKSKLGVQNKSKKKFKLLDPNDTEVEDSAGDKFIPPQSPPDDEDDEDEEKPVNNDKNTIPEVDFNIFEDSDKYNVDIKEYINNSKKMQNIGFKNFILEHEDRVNKTVNRIENETNVKVRDKLFKYLEANNMFRGYNIDLFKR